MDGPSAPAPSESCFLRAEEMLLAPSRCHALHLHFCVLLHLSPLLRQFAQGRVAVFGGKKQVSSSADGGGFLLLRSFLSLSLRRNVYFGLFF